MQPRPGVHVVTGASAGLGAACAAALAASGHQVFAVARRAERLAELATDHPTITPVPADVGTVHGRTAVLAALRGVDQPVASLVHGAATTVDLTPWDQLDPDVLGAHFAVHVAAPIALTAAIHDDHGLERTVLFDSYSATSPRHGWAAYSILKAAAQMAFRAAADELPDVAVLRIFPGAVATPLLDRVLDADPSIVATGFYRELADTGRVSDADTIGRRVCNLLELPVPDLRDRIATDGIFDVGFRPDES